MNNKNICKVTIGLMVYNEAAFLHETIRTIQDQSYDDYEIIVGDNASTDGSSEIIEELAASDSRITHIKRKENIGALQNWNDIVRHASGEYFVLAGGHDLWSPDYLKKLVHALDNNPQGVLAFCRTQWIDEDGNEINIPSCTLDTSGMSRLGRFVSLMYANQNYLYGMTRVAAMKQTRLQMEIIGSGEIYLQELAQLGDFVLVENERWYRRKNRNEGGALERLARYHRILFSSTRHRVKFKLFPYLQMMLHYLLLPFFLNMPLKSKVYLFFVYPLIIIRFIPSVLLLDTKWLLNRA